MLGSNHHECRLGTFESHSCLRIWKRAREREREHIIIFSFDTNMFTIFFLPESELYWGIFANITRSCTNHLGECTGKWNVVMMHDLWFTMRGDFESSTENREETKIKLSGEKIMNVPKKNFMKWLKKEKKLYDWTWTGFFQRSRLQLSTSHEIL